MFAWVCSWPAPNTAMSTRFLLLPTRIVNSGEQSLGAYLYCRTSAFSRFCRTYSSGVSLTKAPVRKSATLPSGTDPTAVTVGVVSVGHTAFGSSGQNGDVVVTV